MLKNAKLYLRALVIFLALVVLISVFPNKARALGSDPVANCDKENEAEYSIVKCVYNKGKAALPDLDIRRTVTNAIMAMVVDKPVQLLTGMSWDQLKECTTAEAVTLSGSDVNAINNLLNGINPPDEDNCGFSIYTPAAQSGGSMLSFVSNVGTAATQKDAVPVNLAYYIKDQIKDVPIINKTAFAATTTYGVFGEEIVLQIWKVFRNAAFGLLSLVMIAIGVMIMVRRKISPQTVVTVENALPRVVLAVFLITFSYPIGATAVALLMPLFDVASGLITSMFKGMEVIPGGVTFTFASQVVIMLVYALTPFAEIFAQHNIGSLVLITAGEWTLLTTALLLFVWAGVIFIAIIKVIIIYTKILMSIVLAPVIFALGSVPGNEKVMTDWFKLLAARVLSVPAMFFVVNLGTAILLAAIRGAMFDSRLFGTILGEMSSSIMWIVLPLICILITISALSVPKKIEEAFVGKKRQ